MFFLSLFLGLAGVSSANYKKLRNSNISLHESLSLDNEFVENINNIIKYVENVLDYDLSNYDVHISPNDLKKNVPFPFKAEPINSIAIDRGEFRPYSRAELLFLICQKVAKDAIVRKINSNLKGAAYVVSLLKKRLIVDLVYRGWVLDGIALSIAREYSSVRELDIADYLSKLGSNSIHKERNSILLSEYILQLKAKYGNEKIEKILFEPFTNLTVSNPLDELDNLKISFELPKRIEKDENDIDISGFRDVKVYNNKLYGIKNMNLYNITDNEIEERDVLNFSVNERGLHYTKPYIDIDNDRLSYDLYTNHKIVVKSSGSEFFDGKYLIFDKGASDIIEDLDGNKILDIIGIKVESLIEYEGDIYISDGNYIYKVYSPTSLGVIGEGRSLTTSGDNRDYIAETEIKEIRNILYIDGERHVQFRRSGFLTKAPREEALNWESERDIKGELTELIFDAKGKFRTYISPVLPLIDGHKIGIRLSGNRGLALGYEAYYIQASLGLGYIPEEKRYIFYPDILLGIDIPSVLGWRRFLTFGLGYEFNGRDFAGSKNDFSVYFGFHYNKDSSIVLRPLTRISGVHKNKIGIILENKSPVFYLHSYVGKIPKAVTIPETSQIVLHNHKKDGEVYYHLLAGLRGEREFKSNLVFSKYGFIIDTIKLAHFVYYFNNFAGATSVLAGAYVEPHLITNGFKIGLRIAYAYDVIKNKHNYGFKVIF